MIIPMKFSAILQNLATIYPRHTCKTVVFTLLHPFIGHLFPKLATPIHLRHLAFISEVDEKSEHLSIKPSWSVPRPNFAWCSLRAGTLITQSCAPYLSWVLSYTGCSIWIYILEFLRIEILHFLILWFLLSSADLAFGILNNEI